MSVVKLRNSIHHCVDIGSEYVEKSKFVNSYAMPLFLEAKLCAFFHRILQKLLHYDSIKVSGNIQFLRIENIVNNDISLVLIETKRKCLLDDILMTANSFGNPIKFTIEIKNNSVLPFLEIHFRRQTKVSLNMLHLQFT